MKKFEEVLGLVQLSEVDPLDSLIDFLELMPAELQALPGNDPRVLAWFQEYGMLPK